MYTINLTVHHIFYYFICEVLQLFYSLLSYWSSVFKLNARHPDVLLMTIKTYKWLSKHNTFIMIYYFRATCFDSLESSGVYLCPNGKEPCDENITRRSSTPTGAIARCPCNATKRTVTTTYNYREKFERYWFLAVTKSCSPALYTSFF